MARIVIVDDDAAGRFLVTKLLQRAGHTVLQAGDGREGLALIQRENPDLVLLDLMLPEKSGWDVMRALRAGPDPLRALVIAFTAQAMVGDRERTLEAGFDGYITKPIAAATFARDVERYLDGGRGTTSAPPPGPGVAPSGSDGTQLTPAAHDRSGDVGHVLVVDDVPQNVALLEKVLRNIGHRVTTAADGVEALERMPTEAPDVVLTDVMMPRMDGFELCRRIKESPATRFLPVVLVTALSEVDDRIRGIEAGADDFLSKPFNREELIARTRSLLRLKRSLDNLDEAENVIRALATAVEAKDLYTEQHTERVARYAVAIGRRLGLAERELEFLQRAGFLHDLGKIAVPEQILLKPGPLDPYEQAIMQQHPETGERICRPLRSAAPLLQAIRHHHERMDGKGYPDRLAGAEIPLHARILAVADTFDALTSDRPYRKGASFERAAEVLRAGAGTQWDPQVVDTFLELLAGGLLTERLPHEGLPPGRAASG